MTAEIPLTHGLVALVDDEDYERVVAAGKWQAYPSRDTFYAKRSVKRPDGVWRLIPLHTFLTGYDLTDHHNGNGLDNRRDNLRPATHAENMRNRALQRNNTSGFKGVNWHSRSRKWKAQIRTNGSKRHVGMFGTPEEAARAYDEAAREFHGEFATVNFPVPGERGAR